MKTPLIEKMISWLQEQDASTLCVSKARFEKGRKIPSKRTIRPAVEMKRRAKKEEKPLERKEEILFTPKQEAAPKKEIAPSKIQEWITSCYPKLKILSRPLDDTQAIKKAHAWKYQMGEIKICYFGDASQLSFLKKLAGAIQNQMGPVKLLNMKSFQDIQALKNGAETPLILSSKEIFENEKMKEHIVKKQTDHYFGDVPLIILSKKSDYERNPELKRMLWNQIKTYLTNHSPA